VLPPRSLVLRCLLGGVGRATEVQTRGDMDVATLRAMVAQLPIAQQAWRDDLSSGSDVKKAPVKDGKGGGVDAEDLVPIDKLVLLGVGVDLETAEGDEGDGEGGAAAPAAVSTPGGLVHLRDGHLLSAYGLETGSILYLVIEGKAQA